MRIGWRDQYASPVRLNVWWRAAMDAASPQGVKPAGTAVGGLYTVTFDHWFEQHERQIYSYLYRITGDRHLASDLAQETFLRAWQHVEVIASYEDPLGWLLRVATNLALNARRNRVRLWRVTTPLSEHEDLPGADDTRSIADQQVLHDTLRSLPPRARSALILREVYGLSLEEVARVLAVSPAAAKKLLSRAREQFRQRYLREEAQP
ncbi:MAG TPA: RNA polymerase sigma factor [Ktedonobacterales bacterium]|nr:RNA polymerase sigma factor [Ktedonobacterales bacterium]